MGAVLTTAALGAFALARLEPAAPTADLATLVTDTVRRGTLTREVRGPGTLVPERLRLITAPTSARVERVLTRSGESVSPRVVLLELSNTDLQLQSMQADRAVRQAQIDLLNLKVTLTSQRLTQQGLIATLETQLVAATQDAEAAES
ncbi:MAG: hypothetical protein MUE41_17210, partial [Gemmatimonadaceae bacterium]|nr:hypothetical protein [Gemmatimonadaceae bacterium]